MKLNPPLIGNFFLPSLGLAALSLAIGYWLSRRRNDDTQEKTSQSDGLVHSTSTTEIKLQRRSQKKKKHKCNCGSEKTSKFETPPTQIKIMYGTLTGKSKV